MDIQMRGKEEIEGVLEEICHLEFQLFILERVNQERGKISARLHEAIGSDYNGIRFLWEKKKSKAGALWAALGVVLWTVLSAGLLFSGIWNADYSLFGFALLSFFLQITLEMVRGMFVKKRWKGKKNGQKTIDQSFVTMLAAQMKTADAEIRLLHRQRDHLYKCINIPREYRNLSAVSKLYEYIASGRCSILEGESGAYLQLEEEIAQKHIIICEFRDSLKLRKIKNDQYMLYQAIQESDKMLDELCEFTKETIINIYVFHCRK